MRLQPLKGYDAFGHVFRTGRRFSNGSVTALVVFPDPDEHSDAQKSLPTAQQIVRFGVTARKRTRPAVLRNRIKRLLRDSLRHVAREYAQQGEPPPFRELVLIWNAVPQKPGLLHLQSVLPAVRDVVDRAVRFYRKERGINNQQ